MTNSRAFVKDRVRVCRLLDEDEFDRFAKKWKAPQPRVWLPNARLILMHKIWVSPGIHGFTSEERQVSRDWLADHGYSEGTNLKGAPCPDCGSTVQPNFSNCATCGMAQ